MLRAALLALALAACSNEPRAVCSPPENVDGGLPLSPALLPSGACAAKSSCVYIIDRCDAGAFPTASDEWTCTCDGASWTCTLTLAGKGLCPFDAAAD